jgi:hypothetical protein
MNYWPGDTMTQERKALYSCASPSKYIKKTSKEIVKINMDELYWP